MLIRRRGGEGETVTETVTFLLVCEVRATLSPSLPSLAYVPPFSLSPLLSPSSANALRICSPYPPSLLSHVSLPTSIPFVLVSLGLHP